MIPSTSCALDVPSHLIFHLLHNSYLPSNDFELMGYTVELLTVFLTRIHIFSSSIKCGGVEGKEVPQCQSCFHSEPPCLGPSSLLRVKGCNCLSEHPKPCKQREALISTHLWRGPRLEEGRAEPGEERGFCVYQAEVICLPVCGSKAA